MSLDLMKTKAEILRVQSAKAEMEVNVFERQLDIERLERNIEIQNTKLIELKDKLEKLQGVSNE